MNETTLWQLAYDLAFQSVFDAVLIDCQFLTLILNKSSHLKVLLSGKSALVDIFNIVYASKTLQREIWYEVTKV